MIQEYQFPSPPPHRRRRRKPKQMVGLFGLPTEAGMSKKLESAADKLERQIKRELAVPKIMITVAAGALILWLWSKR